MIQHTALLLPFLLALASHADTPVISSAKIIPDDTTITVAGQDFWLQTPEKAHSFTPGDDLRRYEVRKGDRWKNDAGSNFMRCELCGQTTYQNKLVTVTYEVKVDPGSPVVPDWLLLGQFHQTDVPGKRAAPPFGLYIESVKGAWQWIVLAHTSPEKTFKEMPPSQRLGTAPFKRGAWQTVKVEFKDSAGQPGGIIRVWIDGAQVVDFSGHVGFNDPKGSYWKEGIYTAEETNWKDPLPADWRIAVEYRRLKIEG